jgi:hypothetical protein
MTKQDHNLRREIKQYLDAWGWTDVKRLPETTLARVYIEEYEKDPAIYDSALKAIQDVKRAHGY